MVPTYSYPLRSTHLIDVKVDHIFGPVLDHLEAARFIHHRGTALPQPHHTGEDHSDVERVTVIFVLDVVTDIEGLGGAGPGRAQVEQGEV